MSIPPLIALLLPLLAACAPSSSPPGPLPFQFKTAAIVPLDAWVSLDGAPLPFCHVQVQASAGGTIYNGATNASGRVVADLNLPQSSSEVVLVLQYPGASGEHTDAVAQEAMGVFAPSARLVLPIEELTGLQLSLTSEDA